MNKELEQLLSNVKSLVDAKGVTDDQIENLKTQLGQFKTLSEENAGLKQQLSDLKDIVSTIETKQKSANVVIKDDNGEEAAKIIVKEWLHAGKQISLKEFAVNHAKALNVGTDTSGADFPTYGGSAVHTVDRILGTQIHEAAREASNIFNELGRKSVSSTDYSELVLQGYPNVKPGIEQMGGADGTSTSIARNFTATQAYKRVHLSVGKQYAKPLISTEAMNDPAINVYAHLQQLLVREQSYYWEWMCLYGDGSKDNIRGILSDKRLKIANATDETGDSWKPTINQYNAAGVVVTRARGVEYFPAISSMLTTEAPLQPNSEAHYAETIDFLIDMESYLPTMYLAGAKFYMNRRTRAILKKLRNTDGSLLLTSETTGGFALLGYPVVIADFLPDLPTEAKTEPTEASWLIFGDLNKAAAIADIDENYLIDPYTVDGAVQIKSDIRKGDIMQANDAIVVAAMSVNADTPSA